MNLTQKHKIEKGFRINIEEALYFNLFNKQINKLGSQYNKFIYPQVNLENKYKVKEKISRPCLVYERIGDFLILIPFTTSENFIESNKTIKNTEKDSLLKVPFFLLDLDHDFIEKNKTAKFNTYHWGTKKEITDNCHLIDKYNYFLKKEYPQLFSRLSSLIKDKDILNRSLELNHLLYEVIIKDDGKDSNE